jgi:hypothetical protein
MGFGTSIQSREARSLGGGGGGWAQRSQATRCSMYNMSHLLDAVVLDAVCIHPGLLDIILDVVVLYVV